MHVLLRKGYNGQFYILRLALYSEVKVSLMVEAFYNSFVMVMTSQILKVQHCTGFPLVQVEIVSHM